MKKIITLLLVFLMLFALCACEGSEVNYNQNSESVSSEVNNEESNQSYSSPIEGELSKVTPLFWKATGKNGEIIWLLGSIHVGTPEYYPLPKAITEAFNSSDYLAVECDIVAFESDIQAALDVVNLLAYSDGTTIKDHIPLELYGRAVKVLNDAGQYSLLYDYYKPAFWEGLISNICVEEAGLDTKLGIDMHFLKDAKAKGKKIVEIESAMEQYSMLTGFSEELEIELLTSAVESRENKSDVDGICELIVAWGEGDEEAIGAMILPEDGVEFSEIENEYWDAMYSNRNKKMADFCVEALKSGEEAFVVVGLAHFFGEDGIINLLIEEGYTVEKITY